jgi:hypothetical protein
MRFLFENGLHKRIYLSNVNLIFLTGDYGEYEPSAAGGQSLPNNNNNSLPKPTNQPFQSAQNIHQLRTNFHNGINPNNGGRNGPPFLVPNPAYSLDRGLQQQQTMGQNIPIGHNDEREHQLQSQQQVNLKREF